jgi:hypothetical protein
MGGFAGVLTCRESLTGSVRAELDIANEMYTVFSPRPNAKRIAALIAREVALNERADRVEPGLSARQRREIDQELAVLHRLLEQLGFQRTG